MYRTYMMEYDGILDNFTLYKHKLRKKKLQIKQKPLSLQRNVSKINKYVSLLLFGLRCIFYLHPHLYPKNRCKVNTMGLTGFDSGMKWYVSTRSIVCWLLNLSKQQFNWRKQLRSRCLIEVQ